METYSLVWKAINKERLVAFREKKTYHFSQKIFSNGDWKMEKWEGERESENIK